MQPAKDKEMLKIYFFFYKAASYFYIV